MELVPRPVRLLVDLLGTVPRGNQLSCCNGRYNQPDHHRSVLVGNDSAYHQEQSNQDHYSCKNRTRLFDNGAPPDRRVRPFDFASRHENHLPSRPNVCASAAGRTGATVALWPGSGQDAPCHARGVTGQDRQLYARVGRRQNIAVTQIMFS